MPRLLAWSRDGKLIIKISTRLLPLPIGAIGIGISMPIDHANTIRCQFHCQGVAIPRPLMDFEDCCLTCRANHGIVRP